jgi:hypothetical protein
MLIDVFTQNIPAPLQEYMAEHGGYLPTVQQCLDARDPDIDLDDESTEIYVWLWTQCFPAAANRFYWGKHNFLDYCPSGCIPGERKHRANVSIASEALFLVQLESNRDRWAHWHQETQVNLVTVTATDMRTDPRYKAKYSLAFNGQEKFKGFSEEGLERFEELKGLVKNNRIKDLQQVQEERRGTMVDRIIFLREQFILNRLRESSNKKTKKRDKNKRKRKADEPVPKKRICTRDDDDNFNPLVLFNQKMRQASDGDDDESVADGTKSASAPSRSMSDSDED